MGAYFTGTLLASPIVRGSSGDTYGTHHSILGVGGYLEVGTISERNALPVDNVNGLGFDGISSGQRRLGMLVYVHAEDNIYQLQVARATWSGLTNTQKLTALGNNNNWNVVISTGGDSSGDKIIKEFNQTTHGFSIGDVIGYDGTEFTKVNSINAETIEPLGIVSEVVDINNFKLTLSGYISTASITDVDSNVISGGTVYYLSSTSGKITPTNPTGLTETSKPMLVGLDDNIGVVLQYRGIGAATLTYDQFTGYTASTKIILDGSVSGATNLGFFSGFTSTQTLPISYLSDDDFDGDYISQYNNYYRDSDGYVRIGIPPDGIARRGYVRIEEPNYSWIWNEYLGDDLDVGWILLDEDISSDTIYGEIVTGASAIQSSTPYTNATWTEGQFYSSGGDIIVDQVVGNLTTGTIFYSGGPIYKNVIDKKLELRTIVSKTPGAINVEYDNYFIKLSGQTRNLENVGSGIGIYSGTTNGSINLKSLVGAGGTTITDNEDSIIISSSGTDGVTSGENVTKQITKTLHGFTVGDVVGWKDGTYSKAIADGTYDGEVIGIVSAVPNVNTFKLTQSGYITGLTGLVTDKTYFVSPTVPGNITFTIPTTVGNLVKPILASNSVSSGWVLPYLGYEISESITGQTGGNVFYTGATPSNVAVGALSIGTTLTGRTISSILEEMLITTIYPTLNNPVHTFTENANSSYEFGTVIPSITFTAGYDKGEILLSGSFESYRSGDIDKYFYSGPGLPSEVDTDAMTNVNSISNWTVSANTTWNSCVKYFLGPQPKDSDGNDYDSPYPSGITTAISRSVSGFYPYYWGTYDVGSVPAGTDRPTGDTTLVTGGTKVLNSGSGDITVDFNSSDTEYIWFAIPSTSTSKTSWIDTLNSSNNGSIGGVVSPGGNLFPDPNIVSISSGQGCWSGIDYKIYVSNYQASTANPICLKN